MTKAGQIGLVVMVAGMVLIGTISCALLTRSPQTITYQVSVPDEVHIRDGSRVVLHDPDATKVYVVDAGATLSVTRTPGNPARLRRLRLRVLDAGVLEAEGTNIDVNAEPGSQATVANGVTIDAVGATVYARGDAQVKALKGAIVHNSGTGDEHAYAGSITYAQMRGRVFAGEGAIVYARSPQNCDACTQVEAGPGSTVFVYEGAEAFAKQATVTVYKGGEVGCYRGCTLYLFPEAEFNYGPDCAVHQMTADSPIVPFKE